MPIIATASEGQTFTPAPEGVHHAVCVDVIDLGHVKSAFLDDKGNEKWQHKVNVVWQISETRDDGKRYQLYKRFTLSLHEKAALRHDLESWRGRPFTDDELRGFDVEKLIGANCLLNVVHRKSADGTKTYANVVSVMPLIKGMPKLEPLDYARAEPPQSATEPASPDYHGAAHTPVTEDLDESEIPF